MEKIQRQIAIPAVARRRRRLQVIPGIKALVIRWGLKLVRRQWSAGKERVKVLIQVNRQFSETSWRKLFNDNGLAEADGYEFVFSRNKFETVKHFAKADYCFLFGFSRFLVAPSSTERIVYIPLLGREALNEVTLPLNTRVTGPDLDQAPAAIAEYCIAMLISFRRSLHASVKFKSSRNWNQQPFLKDPYQNLSQKVIGVLGMGKVGGRIAGAFHALGCKVVACSRTARQSDLIREWYGRDELERFLGRIDVLIVALPLTSETKNIISARQLECLAKGSIIINISRGAVVCQSALVAWLKSDGANGAILDVFSQEPLPRKSPFFELQNVMLTPHISGNINLFFKDIQLDFIRQITAKK